MVTLAEAIKSAGEANTRTASFSGRDKTADLVDCSTLHTPDEFCDLSLDSIAHALAAPFKVDVKVNTKVGERFPVFKLQPGETAFEVIERVARLRGVLLMADVDGHLLLTKPGANRGNTSLVQGVNLLSAEGEFDFKERYNLYVVKGQQQGFDEMMPEISSQVSAKAHDPNIDRYRPLFVLSEGQVDTVNAQKRANWEATVLFFDCWVCSRELNCTSHDDDFFVINVIALMEPRLLLFYRKIKNGKNRCFTLKIGGQYAKGFNV